MAKTASQKFLIALGAVLFLAFMAYAFRHEAVRVTSHDGYVITTTVSRWTGTTCVKVIRGGNGTLRAHACH